MKGIVKAIGSDADTFKVSDTVFSIAPDMLGAWTEYVYMDEKYAVLKPEGAAFEEAATLPMVGTTVLAAVRNFYGDWESEARGDSLLLPFL